jgi:hypothetical protein
MSASTSLLQLCVAHAGGVRRGARVAGFIVSWAIASESLGRAITVETGFLEFWGHGYNERTAYRHLQEFRAVFPGHENPQAFADKLIEHRRRHRDQPITIQSPAPAAA